MIIGSICIGYIYRVNEIFWLGYGLFFRFRYGESKSTIVLISFSKNESRQKNIKKIKSIIYVRNDKLKHCRIN